MLPPIVLLHVSGGVVGLVSGAVALSFRKGSRPHRVAGNVFFISMLIAAAAGTYLGFRNSEMDNFFGGILVIYLLATAWVTARRRDGETGIFDWVGFLVAVAVGLVSVTYAIEAAHSPTVFSAHSESHGIFGACALRSLSPHRPYSLHGNTSSLLY